MHANATSLTHGYVLYVVALHTDSIADNAISNFFPTFLILRVVYCQFCKATHMKNCCLVPRPLPDFISQPWMRDKIWEGPGDEARKLSLET